MRYTSKLNLIDTEIAIKFIKDNFENELAKELDLIRVSAPLFTLSNTGINDDLNGVERPVKFDILNTNKEAEIVHSLAKWKRVALKRYNIPLDKGIYTDMNAIRRDEKMDFLHSIYVDQWDWERRINEEERNLDYLKEIVKKIYRVILNVNKKVISLYPTLTNYFPPKIEFFTTSELLDMYPNLSNKERENEIVKKCGAVFIIGIGDKLKDGKEHDLRAPDYDDWKLNGDILINYPPLNQAVELSSMGIRVNKESLQEQLIKAHKEERTSLPFHKALLNDELPLSIGGGIGQSRMCLVMLNKIHIGEVQSSIWDEETLQFAKKNNITLL